MAYWLLENDSATYAVDWDIVLRIVRSFHRARARFDCAESKASSESAWYSPLSWALPEVTSIEVDLNRVRSQVNRFGDADFSHLAQLGTRDVPEMARQLRWMVSETSRLTTNFLNWQATTQSENSARMQAAVDTYSGAIEVARFVRDTSADGLMVGSSILTGGGSLALLGGASALKGYGKYQDTDKVGAAMLYGVGNLVFGAFKLGGGKLSLREEAVVVIMQAKWETGVALAEGKSLGDALAIGSLKLAGPFVDRFFKVPILQTAIQRWSIPITVGANLGVAQNVVGDVTTKMLSKITQKQGIERGGKALIQSLHDAGAIRPNGNAAPRLMESLTFTDDTLLTLAIVNMARGIGNGL